MFKIKLSTNKYLSSEVFKQDVHLFQNIWLFAGFKYEIEKRGDYLVKKFPFGEIVIRNFGDKIKAFFNICPHRFSRLFSESTGNSIIECPYHGWRFDEDGKPSAIPHKKECFGDLNDLENLSLKFIELEICGEFIFIRVFKDENSPTLIDYLGKDYSTLIDASKFLTNKIDTHEYEFNANWKIVIENSLEEYHLLKVHPETLAQVLSPGIKYKFESFSSTSNIELKENNALKLKKIKTLFNESLDLSGYQHTFIFPNLAIATTEGVSFFIQEAWPTSEDTTRYISHGFLPTFKTSCASMIQNQIAEQYKNTNRKIFNEDLSICNGIQIALNSAINYSGILGKREERILHFQNIYLKLSP